MYNLILTQNSTFIIGPVAKVLGFLMQGIFWVLSKIDNIISFHNFQFANVGIAIIIFTVVVYLLLLPLTIKQQKFSKLSAKMNPEIQAIQAKYKNTKDPNAMQQMTNETNAVYAKYGVSPTGSCLQLLIQMPILFALYRVIYNIPAYVPMVKDKFQPLVDKMIMSSTLPVEGAEAMNSVQFLQTLTGAKMFSKYFKEGSKFLTNYDLGSALFNTGNESALEMVRNSFIDILNRASLTDWDMIKSSFDAPIPDLVNTTLSNLDKFNSFLGLNMAYSPWDTMKLELYGFQKGWTHHLGEANWLIVIVAVLIPILAAVTQWVGLKLAPQATDNNAQNNGQDNPMMSSMKMMNNTMPLMSAFFCFTLPCGMGIYWVVGAVVRAVQQVIINKHIDKMDIDALIEKNTAKYQEKLKKKGTLSSGLSQAANQNTKKIDKYKNYSSAGSSNYSVSNNSKTGTKTKEQKEEEVKKANEYLNKVQGKKKDSSGGTSLADKANMVKRFNEQNNK